VIFGSVCSGIEAASVAWNPLGWEASFFSEIEKFPSAVLAHHYPNVPNLGDMTKFKEWPDYAIDVLVGGTPCQSFSIAGLRKGLDDPRGNLMLIYLAIAARYRPRFLVWENVPGVLSINGGKDFGTFLGGLGELGYGFAYRILDAQYAGVPQRRRRVFVVGHLGDWRRAAAVLFERHSLSGDTAPRREKGQEITGTIGARTTAGGGFGGDFETTGGLQAVASTEASCSDHKLGTGYVAGQSYVSDVVGSLCADTHPGAYSGQDAYTGRLIAHSLCGEGFDASEDGTGRGTPLVPIAFDCKASGQNGFVVGSVASTLRSMSHANSRQNGGGQQAVCFAQNTRDEVREMSVVGALSAQPGMKQTSYVRQSMQVRRLTPRECERLQGFPDDYTLIPGKVADGPRYKSLGNSMAVPVMRWIGERIDAVNRIAAMPKREVA
jgi:DNA (cytosine-5)-methyltransferase 1